MSRWNDKADRMAAKLQEMPEVWQMPVFVHREGDILTLVGMKTKKTPGCVIVKWLGGSNPNRKSSQLRIGARFSISLWIGKATESTAPVCADDLAERMAETLHGWTDETPGALVHRLEVTGVALVPEAPNFLVYEILAEISRI